MTKNYQEIIKQSLPESNQAKLDFLKRSPEQRRQEVLSMTQAVVESAVQHPEDKDNPVNVWSTSHDTTWFYVNNQLNITTANDTPHNYQSRFTDEQIKNADPGNLTRMCQTRQYEDVGHAAQNAIGIVAIRHFVNQGDYFTALMVLSSRPDLTSLPDVVTPLNTWLAEQSTHPNFLTEIVPNLLNSEQYPHTNLVRCLVTESTSPIQELVEVGQDVAKYQSQKAYIKEKNWNTESLERDVYTDIRDKVRFSPDTTPESTTDFHNAWYNEVKLVGPDSLKPVEHLAKLCQTEWFTQLPNSETKREVINTLTAATLVELNQIAKQPSTNNLELATIGEALSTIKQFAPAAISENVKLVIENFGEKKPGLKDDLNQVIAKTDERFSHKAAITLAATEKAAEEMRQQLLAENTKNAAIDAAAEKEEAAQLRRNHVKELASKSIDELKQLSRTDSAATELLNTLTSLRRTALLNTITVGRTLGLIGGRKVVDPSHLATVEEKQKQLRQTEKFKEADMSALIKDIGYSRFLKWAYAVDKGDEKILN